MAYSLRFVSPDGGTEEFFLCSTSSWDEFRKRVKSTPNVPRLTELVEKGEADDTASLAVELENVDSPLSPVLGELVGVGSGSESVYLFQGTEQDD